MTPTIQVRVLHNDNPRDARCFGYRDGDGLTEVWACELPTTTRDPFEIAEVVYAICNSSPGELFGAATRHPGLVADYRARRVPSLSVGDVVVLAGDVGLAVASFGFERITQLPGAKRSGIP
jgi:hypothetical protein